MVIFVKQFPVTLGYIFKEFETQVNCLLFYYLINLCCITTL